MTWDGAGVSQSRRRGERGPARGAPRSEEARYMSDVRRRRRLITEGREGILMEMPRESDHV